MPQRPRNPSGFVRKHPDTSTERWQGIVKYWNAAEQRWRPRSKAFARAAEAQAWVDAAKMEHRTRAYRPLLTGRRRRSWAAGQRAGIPASASAHGLAILITSRIPAGSSGRNVYVT